MYIVSCYLAYLALSLSVTVWVASTLHKNGRVFLVEAFHRNEALADSVNHLLVVGFYLINVGYVSLVLRSQGDVTTARQAIEMVSEKMGGILMVLGFMHFLNLFIFSRLRRRGQEQFERPPFPPDAHLTVPPPLAR